MTYLIDEVDKSEIVKEQIANPDIDVFTGLKFKTDETVADTDSSSETVSDSTADTESKADKTADSSDTDKKAGLVAGDSSMEIPEGMTEEQYKALMEPWVQWICQQFRAVICHRLPKLRRSI